MTRDLIGLAGLDTDQIRRLLVDARAMAARPPMWRGPLDDMLIGLVFLEDSTRTRVSFEIAAQRLGGWTIELSGRGSSVAKGESLADTVRTIEALGVDAIVLRARQDGAAEEAAGVLECPLINAGAGTQEHPTQGLLDAYVFAEAHGRLDTFDLSGLTYAIVGDVDHSRVARSDIAAMTRLGARVICVGPESMCHASIADLGCVVERDFERALQAADAVQMLRMQFERHEEAGPTGASPLIGSLADYRAGYALTADRVKHMKPSAAVMHPGPANRGLEIDDFVADSPRALIRRQVTCGVWVRMAVLAQLVGKG
jgi:aspartate carbamoyltransferase catalytic subunit